MKKTALQCLGALLAGALLASLWAPFEQNGNVWFALVPLLLTLRGVLSLKRAFWLGWLTGFVSWCVQLSWMFCLTDNGGPWPLVVPALLGLSAVLAVYVALFAMMVVVVRRRIAQHPGIGRIITASVVVPVLWAACEVLRATLFSGFAWNPLGLATVNQMLPVAQLAAIGGSCLVSALVVAINEAITTIIERFWWSVTHRSPTARSEKVLLSIESSLAFAALLVAFLFGYSRMNAYDAAPKKRDAVVVVQHTTTPCIFKAGAVVPMVWDVGASFSDIISFFKADVWLWPESAVVHFLPHRGVEGLLTNLATNAHTPLFVGGSYQTPTGGYYNAAMLFTEKGLDQTQVYAKRHLVPFGEYIPFDKQIPALQKLVPTGFSCEPGDAVRVVQVPSGLKLGPLICFEDTVASVARDSALAGAELLVNMSNDAWYSPSAEPAQHAQQAIFRCIETGLPMMRSTNAGLNTVIDAVGRAQVIEPGSFPTRVPVTEHPFASFYLQWGELVFGAPCVVFLLMLLFALAMERCKMKKVTMTAVLMLVCFAPGKLWAGDELLPMAEMAMDDGNVSLAERTAQTVLTKLGLAPEERAKAEEVLIRAALKRGEWENALTRIEACPELPADRRLAFRLAALSGKKDFAQVLKEFDEAQVATDSIWGVTALRYGLLAAQELGKKLLAAERFSDVQSARGATDVIRAENALAWDAYLPNEASRRALLEAAAKADRGGVFLACALALPTAFSASDPGPALACLRELLNLKGLSSGVEAQLALAAAELAVDVEEKVLFARRAVAVAREERIRQKALYELGKQLCANPLTLEEGVSFLNQAVTLNPSTKLAPEIQFKIAEILHASSDSQAALNAYNRYLESYDVPVFAVRVRQGKGRLLVAMARFDEALTMFLEAAEFATEVSLKTALLLEAAEAATAAKRYSSAIEIYRGLLREGARTGIPLRLARCLEASGDKEGARREYAAVRDDVSSSEQDVFTAVMRLAGMLIEENRVIDAIAEYTRLSAVLTREELKCSVLLERGRAYYKLDKLQLAIEDFAKVSESNASTAEEARFFLVLCYYRLGEDERARELAQAYVSLYPESTRIPDVVLWLAKSDFNRGDYAAAKEGFLDFTTRWPTDGRVANALYLAARAAYQNQDYAAAVELIGRLARIMPDSELIPNAQFLQAQALVEQARHAEARDLLNALVRRYPNAEWIAEAYGLRGDCLAYTAIDDPERYTLALASYREAVLRLEDDLDISLMYLFRIGRVLERQNRRDDAAEQYTKLIYRVLNCPEISTAGKQWFQKALVRLRTLEVARGNLAAFEALLHRVRRAQIPDVELP